MSIPSTITKFVNDKHIEYLVVTHPPSQTSLESAHSAHVKSDHVAKGVLLHDGEGYVLAVLPATRDLQLSAVARRLERQLTLTPEERLKETFTDCAPGAVPALGPAYGLRTIVDSTLADAEEVYFEAGDHEELIRVTGEDFRTLLPGAEFAAISRARH